MKLTRGQKFPGIDANVYNKQLDMVRNFEAGEPTDSFPPNDKAEDIWIVYPVDGSQGTSNIPCFGIVGLGPLVITPTLSLPGFVESLTVELASPEPREPFAVLQDPLGYDSAVARNATANVHGITRCKIDVTDEDHGWAAPESGNMTSLLSQARVGPARVLWKESGTGVVWAVVYLDQSGRDEPFVAYLDGSYGILDGQIVYSWTEQVWGDSGWEDGDREGSETAGPFLFEINNRVVRLPCYVRAFYRGTLDGQACYDFDRCCGNVLGEGTPAVHTVDALLMGAFTRTHMIDAYLRHNPSINHRLDAYLVNKRTKVHTTDAYLVARRFKTHTTDGYLVRRPTPFHTTNAWLANVRAKVHTTDAYLSINGEKTHTTDAWLANLRTKTHSTNAWLANLRAVVHSTDSYLRPLHSVNHATDAYLVTRLSGAWGATSDGTPKIVTLIGSSGLMTGDSITLAGGVVDPSLNGIHTVTLLGGAAWYVDGTTSNGLSGSESGTWTKN